VLSIETVRVGACDVDRAVDVSTIEVVHDRKTGVVAGAQFPP
jgi:hypothetical protein